MIIELKTGRPIMATIFDVDDTLLDNLAATEGGSIHARARLKAIHAVGIDYNLSSLTQLNQKKNLELFNNSPIHTIEAAIDNILAYCKVPQNLRAKLSAEIIARRNIAYEEVFLELGKPYPGALEFVARVAKNIGSDRMAIASTASRIDLTRFIEGYNLSKIFSPERIFCKEDTKHHKPNPEVFNVAFESFGLSDQDRKNVLVFEDDPRGVEAAKRAGLRVYGFTSRYTQSDLMNKPFKPDLVYNSYADLNGLFET